MPKNPPGGTVQPAQSPPPAIGKPGGVPSQNPAGKPSQAPTGVPISIPPFPAPPYNPLAAPAGAPMDPAPIMRLDGGNMTLPGAKPAPGPLSQPTAPPPPIYPSRGANATQSPPTGKPGPAPGAR